LRAVAHLDDIEIERRRRRRLRRNSSSQSGADPPACVKSRKAQANRLLDLVSLARTEQHPGDVGLDQPHGGSLARLEAGTQRRHAGLRRLQSSRFRLAVHESMLASRGGRRLPASRPSVSNARRWAALFNEESSMAQSIDTRPAQSGDSIATWSTALAQRLSADAAAAMGGH
jgi:hypothetical protein